MSTYTIAYTARIGAPAAIAYGIIADYVDGHPHILPPKYFRDFTVVSGGRGAGTRIAFSMGAMGKWTPTVGEVTEPEPGRLLHEFYPDSGVLTTFLVNAVDAATCDVTFTTYMPRRAGIGGAIERLTVPAFLRRVYRDEMALLDAFARSRATR